MTYEYYGYPPDWRDKYQAEIKKVSAPSDRVAEKLHKVTCCPVVGNTRNSTSRFLSG